MKPFKDDEVVAAFTEFNITLPDCGSGAAKTVYLASRDSQDLALKILHDPVPDGAVEYNESLASERFIRELRALQETDCPHVIRVLDMPELRLIGTSTHIWYTEPFLGGGTLHQRLKASKTLSSTDLEVLARGMLLAIEAMWTQGRYVHRDIKPKNIGYQVNGTPVLMDFGIALFTEMTDLTSASLAGPGTSKYAAPEQFQPRRDSFIDFRTDMFQLGIVLAESATGRHPFWGASDYMNALYNFDPKFLDGAGISTGLLELISRLLQGHQSRRFRTVKMALDTLDGA